MPDRNRHFCLWKSMLMRMCLGEPWTQELSGGSVTGSIVRPWLTCHRIPTATYVVVSRPKCWRDWGPLSCHIQTTITKILLRVPHCASLGESHHVWSRGWCTHEHQALQCQRQGCPQNHTNTRAPHNPPQVEPQLHFSQDSASLSTSSWNLVALWPGWGRSQLPSSSSQTLNSQPTLPITGSSPRDCPEQYLCFVLFCSYQDWQGNTGAKL